MSSTDKVIGAIGALSTLIENFPMSILDLLKGGKTYTSSFEFMMDVLQACGVSTDEIIGRLLEDIYSITPNIEEGLENYKDDIAKADFTKVEESKFFKGLEDGIREILNGLLASVYGCSAIPVLPNNVMDYPKYNPNSNKLWDNFIYPGKFEIPIKMIDPMGLLEITPGTIDGRVYYDILGSDVYYKKIKNENKSTFSFRRSVYFIDNPIKINIINNELFAVINDIVVEDIEIKISYIRNNNLLHSTLVIKAGENKSEKSLNLDYIVSITKITINNSYNGTIISDNIWCFLEKNDNTIFSNNVIWGTPKNEIIMGVDNDEYSDYSYIKLDEVPKDSKKARRLNNVPTNVNENDSDLIVVYDGMSVNDLYKSNDMNAFIWYAITKGTIVTQPDKNLMMWDSRLSSQKRGIIRETNTQWNDWYNSKKTYYDEFLWNNKPITKESALYPIIQLEKSKTNQYAVNVTFPAQQYFKQKYRDSQINGLEYKKRYEFNTSIYKFNRDYLENIKILKPKLLLTGFVNYMLGYSISTLKSINVDFTKKIIETKLSSAIKKIIEADDMEIEDCYTTFSNEEFDEMLEEMLLARYTSTHYGGETNKTKPHNIEDYLALIDSFNASATREESISKINRLVTEILTTPGNEGTIEYGVEMYIDGNLLKKLLWAITMPIIESIFTPQVMLLIIINMSLMGVVKDEDFLGNDMSKIMNMIFNKILGLTKAIVKYVKDAILELLMKLFLEKVSPLLLKYAGALTKEKLEYWLYLLTSALKCLPNLPSFNFGKNYGKKFEFSNDVVNYADILFKEPINIPESALPC